MRLQHTAWLTTLLCATCSGYELHVGCLLLFFFLISWTEFPCVYNQGHTINAASATNNIVMVSLMHGSLGPIVFPWRRRSHVSGCLSFSAIPHTLYYRNDFVLMLSRSTLVKTHSSFSVGTRPQSVFAAHTLCDFMILCVLELLELAVNAANI